MLFIDGCMFGVFGCVLVVIYVIFEVEVGGVLVKVCDGDFICFDVVNGVFDVLVDVVEFVVCFSVILFDYLYYVGMGCELFGLFCNNVVIVDFGVGVF